MSDDSSSRKQERPGALSRPMLLTAYLASALTGLGGSREQVLALQDRIERLCTEHGIEVYRPIKATDPLDHPQVAAEDVYAIDRGQVLSRDLLILMTHVPSFGGGQEVQLASGALIPILLIRPVGKPVSRMLLGIPSLMYEVVADDETLESKLSEALDIVRTISASRREFINRFDKVGIGGRIRAIREERAMKREDLADHVGLSVEEIRCIEEEPVSVSSPTLIVLRKLTEALDVTLAEVCDPMYVDAATADIVKELLHGVPLSAVEYRDSRRSALWRTVAPQDIPRVIRRILNHILEGELI